MARVKLPISNTWLNWTIFHATVVIAGVIAVSSATAQTVVIGGSGFSPVQVNMGALNPVSPYGVYSPQLSQPLANTQIGHRDYSKSSRIVFGDEVINLVPPGSKTKKIKTRVASTKRIVKQKVAAKPTAAPTTEIKVAKVTAPKKMAVETPAAKVAEEPKAAPSQTAAVKSSAEETAAVKEMAPKATVKPETKKETATPEKPVEIVKDGTPTTKPAKEMQATITIVEKSPKVTAKTAEPSALTPPKPEKEMQIAAIAPNTVQKPVATSPSPSFDKPGTGEQIFFKPEQTKLPGSATNQLKTLADVLKSGNDRIQLVAYAGANSNSAARRLSLGRALVVRSKLMELGVPNNKIEVRALGKPKDGSPVDRVDLKLITR
ncbi:MAG: OmpA family protein [Sneathiella sp.]|nr:OmpA family protein [Sneathiella sp.]